MSMNSLQKEIYGEALERAVGATAIPAKYVMRLVREFKDAVKEHRAQIEEQKRSTEEMDSAIRELATVVQRYDAIVESAQKEVRRIRDMKEGSPGRDGRDGKDGKDGKDAVVNMDRLIAQVYRLIREPKDGKDAIIDYKKISKEVLKALEGELNDFKKKMDNEVASYRNQLAGKVYGKDTWARGSGTTVSAGSNITLVPQADGTVQINASGGGSGTNVTTQYQLTATAAGSDAEIDLTQLTHWATFDDLIAVYQNNIMLTETLNFTVAGSTVTVINGTDSDVYNITYGYS